ncbi:MAG: 16S rRNA (cytosine(967)-C(5))-methyltransferase RsmB [Oscillospiraceae bacterium]|nr:16S rRNA (cytosine(967)-C(5))-methyltransferase RsmB [Oscillospiraceae bacterium]
MNDTHNKRPFAKPTAPFAKPVRLDENARAVALNVLQDISRQDAYASLALDKRLTESRLAERDRDFVTRLVYGVTETRITLDYYTDKLLRDPSGIEPLTRDLLRLGAYQIFYMDRVPDHAATNETVAIAKILPSSAPFASLINSVLHRLIEQLNHPAKSADLSGTPGETISALPEDPVERLSIEMSFPLWLTRKLIDVYGFDEAKRFLEYRHDHAFLTVRRNSLRAGKEEFERRMTKAGWTFAEWIVPGTYRVKGIGAVGSDKLYRGGFMSVIGQSSILAAEAVQAKPGMRILDACAAPGGKSCHMAERMNGAGRVIAWDVYDHRVELIRAQAGRLAIENIRPVVHDATVPVKDMNEMFDAVLIDAPCSGLGVTHDKPDARYRLTQERLTEMEETQRNILKACAPLVKRGGALVYSTCTVLPEENQLQVKRFLEEHEDYRLDKSPLYGFTPDEFGIRLLPHRDHVEGFFVAKMVRK